MKCHVSLVQLLNILFDSQAHCAEPTLKQTATAMPFCALASQKIDTVCCVVVVVFASANVVIVLVVCKNKPFNH